MKYIKYVNFHIYRVSKIIYILNNLWIEFNSKIPTYSFSCKREIIGRNINPQWFCINSKIINEFSLLGEIWIDWTLVQSLWAKKGTQYFNWLFYIYRIIILWRIYKRNVYLICYSSLILNQINYIHYWNRMPFFIPFNEMNIWYLLN